MIIQSSNNPIVIEFSEDMTDISALRISLWHRKEQLKVWTKSDVTIDGTTVTCNLTQEETKSFPTGTCILEIKYLEDELTKFTERVEIEVKERNDTTEMGDVD